MTLYISRETVPSLLTYLYILLSLFLLFNTYTLFNLLVLFSAPSATRVCVCSAAIAEGEKNNRQLPVTPAWHPLPGVSFANQTLLACRYIRLYGICWAPIHLLPGGL